MGGQTVSARGAVVFGVCLSRSCILQRPRVGHGRRSAGPDVCSYCNLCGHTRLRSGGRRVTGGAAVADPILHFAAAACGPWPLRCGASRVHLLSRVWSSTFARRGAGRRASEPDSSSDMAVTADGGVPLLSLSTHACGALVPAFTSVHTVHVSVVVSGVAGKSPK